MSPNSTTNSLIFSPTAVVRYGGNRFINVPVILQVDGTPLIEVVQNNEISRTTRFTLYHVDGTLLGTVVGTCLVCTPEGVKAGVAMQYPSRATICMCGDKILFEVKRVAAAILSITAEIFSPTGLLVMSSDATPFAVFGENATQLTGITVTGQRIRNTRIGFAVTNNGRSVSVG